MQILHMRPPLNPLLAKEVKRPPNGGGGVVCSVEKATRVSGLESFPCGKQVYYTPPYIYTKLFV
jgi:hypothetical protein